MLNIDQLKQAIPPHITVAGYKFELVISSSPDPYTDPYGESITIAFHSKETPERIKQAFEKRNHSIESVQAAIAHMTKDLEENLTTVTFEM